MVRARECYRRAYFDGKDLAESFWQFSKHISGRVRDGLTEDRRREFADFVTDEYRFLMLQAARGSWKSSITVVDYISWLIGRDLVINDDESRIRIALASETEHLAKRNLRGVRNILEGRERYVALVGRQRPPGRTSKAWGRTELTCVARRDHRILEPTLSVMGQDTEMTGTHYDLTVCFDPETWVHTADGLRRVKELRIGDKLLTHEGRYQPVTRLALRQAKERVEVKVKGMMGVPSVVSSDHEFLTPGVPGAGDWWRPIKDLSPGDSVRRPHHGSGGYPCALPDDPDLWWVLGWWVAEGSVISKTRLGFVVHRKELGFVQRFAVILGKYSDTKEYIYYPKHTKGMNYHVRGVAPWIVEYCRKRFYRGPFRKNIPAEIFSLSRESRIAFLKGLWQGDGTAQKEKTGKWAGNITSISEEIVVGAAQLIWDLGINCSVGITNQNRTYRVYFGKGLLELMVPEQRPKQAKNSRPKPFSPWTEISSIKPLGPGPVISVSVDEDRSIAVPGVLTHNCDDLQAERSSSTSDTLENAWEMYRLLLSIMDRKGKILFVCTRWHPEDIYQRIEDTNYALAPDKRFKILKIPADDGETKEIGKLNFPNVLPKEELEALREQQGPRIFNCQYRLRVSDDDDAIFKQEWLQFVYPELLKQRQLNVYTTADFAWTEKGKMKARQSKKPDFTVVETWAVDPKFRYICLDWFRERCSKREAVKEVYRQFFTHLSLMAIMQRYDRSQIADTIDQYGYEYGAMIAPEWIFYPPKAGKRDRIESALAPLFEAGKVYLMGDMDWFVKEEYLVYPKGKYDGFECLANVHKVASAAAEFKARQVLTPTQRRIKQLKAGTFDPNPDEDEWMRV